MEDEEAIELSNADYEEVPLKKERIFFELVTSDCQLDASREGSK